MSATPVHYTNEQARQDLCTYISLALTLLAAVVVGLRFISRGVIVRNTGLDDYAILLALIFLIGYLATIFVLKANGMAFSGSKLTLDQMTTLIKTTLSIEVIYYITIFFIKISILLFYLRIAAERKFELGCKITIGVLTVFLTICIITTLAQCIPIHKMWDFTGQVPGHCINGTAFFYTTSAFNIVTDMWILVLPVKTLMSIQRPGREKVALLFVFGLGIFSCIASIVRLHSIRIYTESRDPFYDSVPINIWSMVEISIGILCASIPSLKPLFFKAQRERTRASTKGYSYHSRDRATPKIPSKQSAGSSTIAADPEESFDMSPIAHKVTDPDHSSNQEISSIGSQERIYFPGGEQKV